MRKAVPHVVVMTAILVIVYPVIVRGVRWQGPREIAMDNSGFAQGWTVASMSPDKFRTNYLYAGCQPRETTTYEWRPNIARAGRYDVFVMYPSGANRSSKAPFTVRWKGGMQTYLVNQKVNGGTWNLIAHDKPFGAGTAGYAGLSNGTGEKGPVVIADAVKFVLLP